jgi:hypothetical protein
MKPKHTPGPWTSNDAKEGLLIVRDSQGFGVTELYTQHDLTVEKANARLIAAAPEMLEALEQAELTIKRINYDYSMSQEAQETLDLIKSVITKAGGES